MTTLENTYCVPKGDEWDTFGLIPLTGHKVMWLGGEPSLVRGAFNDRIEIPVPRFLDLLHDRIVPWRVEEIGGYRYGNDSFYTINLPEHRCVLVHFDERALVDARQLDKGLNIPNITTFTDLLTLIRFLTPNTNKP